MDAIDEILHLSFNVVWSLDERNLKRWDNGLCRTAGLTSVDQMQPLVFAIKALR
jgi:hypothetical protein